MNKNLYCDDCMKEFDWKQFGFNELDYQEQLMVAKDDGWKIGAVPPYMNLCSDCKKKK